MIAEESGGRGEGATEYKSRMIAIGVIQLPLNLFSQTVLLQATHGYNYEILLHSHESALIYALVGHLP